MSNPFLRYLDQNIAVPVIQKTGAMFDYLGGDDEDDIRKKQLQAMGLTEESKLTPEQEEVISKEISSANINSLSQDVKDVTGGVMDYFSGPGSLKDYQDSYIKEQEDLYKKEGREVTDDLRKQWMADSKAQHTDLSNTAEKRRKIAGGAIGGLAGLLIGDTSSPVSRSSGSSGGGSLGTGYVPQALKAKNQF